MWLIDRVFVYHKVLGLILSTRRTLYSLQSLQVGGRGRKIRWSRSFSMHSNFQASQNSITQCFHSLYQLQSILLCLKDFWLVISNIFKPLSSLLSLILTPQSLLETPHALPPLGIPPQQHQWKGSRTCLHFLFKPHYIFWGLFSMYILGNKGLGVSAQEFCPQHLFCS